MGVGKSTTARAVASALDLPHRDSDEDIERLLGRTTAQVAETEGVADLHRLESAVLLGALADPGETVIAAAASVVEDPLCRQVLSRTRLVVGLTLDTHTLLDRIGDADHRRLISVTDLNGLAERRRPLLDEVCHLVLDADRGTAALRNDIVTAWRRQRDARRA